MSKNYILPVDRNLSDATTQGQSGPGSNGSEGVLHITQNSSITEASPLYPGHSLGESYSSAKMQSMYSATPVDWDTYAEE